MKNGIEIKEAYVSYETACKLKECGFDEPLETLIYPDGTILYVDENSVSREKHTRLRNSQINIYLDCVSCPTQQMAMMWLREIRKLAIQTRFDITYGNIPYVSTVVDINGEEDDECLGRCVTYEESVESALKWVLDNIVK